ncbi:hypothetical protein Goari_009855, partial [Gossypium aridum]|nr:hypothetical protein [Gossypium aridum]
IRAKVKAEQYGKDVIILKNLVKELYPEPETQTEILGPRGDDPNLITKTHESFYLNQATQTYKDVSDTLNKFKPWFGAWVSESGGAFHGGGKDVSPTLADGFGKSLGTGQRICSLCKDKYKLTLIKLPSKEGYHLNALDENIQGDVMLLNDVPLVSNHGSKACKCSTPISIVAHSIV